MGFLIRTGFWFSAVLLALPLGAPADGRSAGPIETLSAAREAVSDIAGLCERKPEVCVTGRAAIETISVRAKESARIAQSMMGTPEHDHEQPVDLAGITGSIPVPTPRAEVRR